MAQGAFPIRSAPCGDAVPATMSLRDAVVRLAVDDRAIWPIAAADGSLRAVATLTLRTAAQRQVDATLGELTDPALVHEDESAARAWLEADPRRSAAIARSTQQLLVREVPNVRAAIVMAGGLGSRLRPLTDNTPKPLLEVGDRVLLFRIFDLLRAHGVERVLVSINHLGDQVRAAVGDGTQWGFALDYLEEDEPLDTGAGLALHPGTDEPFFVVNGDILTTLDFGAFGRAHRLADPLVSIATYRYAAPLPYGVVHRDGARVTHIEEKPVYRYDVNAGIYAFSARALKRVTHGEPLAMVDFLNALGAEAGDLVHSFPLVEYWNDVGTPNDFARAQSDVTELGLT